MRFISITALSAFVLAAGFACENHELLPPAFHADRRVTGTSGFPLVVKPELVGEYPTLAKSGGGYFFDEVLEYRVWMCPARGAKRLAGGDDYLFSFAEYENALGFSQTNQGAEAPLALIRQYEWINEPSPGEYEVKRGERIAEWRVAWLKGAKRTTSSISEFLARRGSRRVSSSPQHQS